MQRKPQPTLAQTKAFARLVGQLGRGFDFNELAWTVTLPRMGRPPEEMAALDAMAIEEMIDYFKQRGRKRPVEDAARIMLGSPRSSLEIENVVAETTTVAGIAALARGAEDASRPAWTFSSPFEYRHRLAEYL